MVDVVVDLYNRAPGAPRTSLFHRKQEKYAKANCMTTEAHFLETMKKLDFKQCVERQYQQTLVAKNLC